MKNQKDKLPVLDEHLVKILEKLYPPLEYSPDISQEDWAFRGGQRDVVAKLRHIYSQQQKGEYYA